MSIRVSMDQCRQMTDAALHFQAAFFLREKATGRTMSEVVKDMLERADYHIAVATSLMEFNVESEKTGNSRITPTPNIDLNMLDVPSKAEGAV